MDDVRADVERILARFARELEGFEPTQDVFPDRESSLRIPIVACDPGFRERMLKNAPRHDGKAILAEKRSW